MLLYALCGLQIILESGALVIFEVMRQDAGSYVCRLANAGGMVYHNTTLIVRSEKFISRSMRVVIY